MTKNARRNDCGNSPENQLVENSSVALSTGDHRTVSALVTDDVRWNIVGGEALQGREAVLRALPGANGAPVNRRSPKPSNGFAL